MHGQAKEVLDYLNTKVKAKNKEKLQGLIGYIEKHQEEIIDYDRRKKAGKKVGLKPSPEDEGDAVQNQTTSACQAVKKVVDSRRVEKACDNVIEKPQKHKEVSLNQEEDVDIQNQSFSNAKSAKKVVGSVCYEKACDNVIGKRQKHKAMSWSKLGSRSLAMQESG
jgi:hypothetical protein